MVDQSIENGLMDIVSDTDARTAPKNNKKIERRVTWEKDLSVVEEDITANMFTKFSRNCPDIYNDDDICCLAKIYNSNDNILKLNDVIEIIGIYTADPLLSTIEGFDQNNAVESYDMSDPFGGADEDESQSLPPPR